MTVERGDGWRDDADRDVLNLFLKSSTQLSERLELKLSAQHIDNEQSVAGELPADSNGKLIPLPGGRESNFNLDGAVYDKNIWVFGASLDFEVNDQLSFLSRMHYRDQDTESVVGFFNGFDAGSRLIDFTGFNGYKDVETFFVEQQMVWRSGDHSLVAGASFEKIDAFSGETWTGEFGFDFTTFDFYFYQQRLNVDTGIYVNQDQWASEVLLDADAAADVFAGYVQYGWEATERLKLLVAARYDNFQRDVTYNDTPVVKKSADDEHVSPKAAITYAWSPTLMTYVSYGEGFSPAFGPVWSFNGRPDSLKPEISENIEVGLKGRILDGAISLNLAVYELTRTDLRRRVAIGGGQFRDVNVGESRSRGIEIETVFDLDRQIDGFGAWMNVGVVDAQWIDNTFVSDFTGQVFDFSGNTIARIPEWSLSAGLRQQFESTGLSAAAWVDYSGEYEFDDNNTVAGGDRALIHANLVWRPVQLPALELSLTMRNVFDKNYEDVFVSSFQQDFAWGYPGSPRSVLASMSFSL